MNYLYPIIISFLMIFLSELGDKTQLLVLSFTSKHKASTILLGVALGSFFSHGVAILFGSVLGNLENNNIHNILELITYSSFILLGIITLLSKDDNTDSTQNKTLLKKLTKLPINYSLIIGTVIAIGEFGDKTFLASIGLGVKYSSYKLLLIFGAVLGMVVSDFLAIFLGKFLNNKISEKNMKKISGILFLIFGFLGFYS
ncbi:MAG: TMEM165/GDT1 family protein [Clostridia bacterium]